MYEFQRQFCIRGRRTIKDESIIYARRLFSLMPPSDVTEIKSKIIKEGS